MHDDCVGLGATCKALPERDRVYSSQVLKDGEIEKGSAGSGNFGHDGRPGKKGGSTRGGGLRRIGAKKDSKPGDRKKAAKKFREKRKAKAKDGTRGDKSGEKKIKEAIKNTKEMTKFQKQARRNYDAGEGVDVGAVILGWKLGGSPFNNNVIVNPSGTKKVKILSETGDRLYKIDFNGKIIEKFPAKNIAQAIIIENWAVGREGKEATRNKADLTTRAQSDAPNYQAADTPQRCANCRFFLGDPGRDWCERFDFTADQDYHCDDWEAQRPDEIPGYVANKADLAALTEGILTLRGG
jgi:hypothetical protein